MATESVTSAALMIAGMFKYDRADCGGPMQTVSSASSTCLVLKSAVECTATVLMPSSRHARSMRSAISPRLAMTTFSNIALFDYEQGLTEFDRLTVRRENGRDLAFLVGFDLIHHLHGLDDAENLAALDVAADLDEILGAGTGGGIISADHGRGDGVFVVARLVLSRSGGRGGRLWQGGRQCGGRARRSLHRHARIAADANRFLALGDFQLRNAGFLQQLDQFLNFANVHPRTPSGILMLGGGQAGTCRLESQF